ncbi:hypothetical protein ACTM8Z_00120 [Atopobiaceae bacterium HCP3S3_D6]
MTVSIGAPQAILLAIYFMNLVINCVENGEQTTTHWWASAIALAVNLALLTWGGFFS